MFDLGGPAETFSPDEGGGGSEALSEAARARFAAAAAGAKQARKDEKKAKKRDDGVAAMILQFLSDTQRTHLATLISRLVAMDTPSPFLLAVLSLVSDDAAHAVEEYLSEKQVQRPDPSLAVLPAEAALDDAANHRISQWILSMELTLATNPEETLSSLIVEEGNIDGTVLQLTTFVLEEFLKSHGKAPAFPELQRVTIGILQSVFESYMHLAPLPAAPTTEDDE